MTEILAPAGSKEAFMAAIANGANAIYMGSKDFNARAFADNFGDEELAELIETAHLHQVKVYLTVNTLLRADELPQALELLAYAYECGVDAVIVQDLGLVSLACQVLPELPLHASTQMSIFTAAACELMARHGISRVILARELSLQDLAATKAKTEVELEVFVHGALCVCYSGQCLMSGMIGGRSGNRGRCAQPCRLEYEFIDEAGQVYGAEQGKYLLSPRDLHGYPALEQLHALDLAAWKIEGRMKRPEYVATVTRIYHGALTALENGISTDLEEDMRQLLQIFNRDHCTGYWQGNAGSEMMSFRRPNNRGVFLGRLTAVANGQVTLKLEQPLSVGDGLEVWVKVGGRQGFTVTEMWQDGQPVAQAAPGELVTLAFKAQVKVGDRVFKTADLALLEQAQASYSELPDRPLDLVLTAHLGQPLTLAVHDDEGHAATVSSDYLVAAARTNPSDWPQIAKQLGRMGGSGFCLGHLGGELDEGVMLPASVLNQLRRQAVEALKEQRLAAWRRPAIRRTDFNYLRREVEQQAVSTPAPKIRLSALVGDARQALAAAAAGVREVYVAAESFAPPVKYDWQELAQQMRGLGASLITVLPRVIHESETAFWLGRIAKWREMGVDALVAPNLNALALIKEARWPGAIYGDSGLNVFNKYTAELLAAEGVQRLVLSPELNLEQLQAFGSGAFDKELTVHGAAALMVSEYCALGALVGGRTAEAACHYPCRRQGNYYLKDKKGYCFPCRFDQSCRMHVFNSRSLCLLPDLHKLQLAGIAWARLDLRLYEPGQAAKIIECYQEALAGSGQLAEKWLQELPEEFTKGQLYRGV